MPQYTAKCPISGTEAYLRIAPTEFLKRLVAGGAINIFEFATNFRADPNDDTHLAEFTSLEVMVRNATLVDMQSLTTCLCRAGLAAARADAKNHDAVSTYAIPRCELDADWQIVSLRDIVRARFGFTSDDFFNPASVRELYMNVVRGSSPASSADAFDAIVTNIAFSFSTPIFIGGFPNYLGGPALPCSDDARFKDRSELFFGGLELANMSACLTDVEQVESWYLSTREAKQIAGIRSNDIDEPLLNILRQGLPSSAVLGIGIDRLLMIALAVSDIADVRSFPYGQLFAQ